MNGAGFPGPLGDGDLGPLVWLLHLLGPGWEATMDPLRCPRTGQPKVEGETSGFLLRYLSLSQTPVPQPTLLAPGD